MDQRGARDDFDQGFPEAQWATVRPVILEQPEIEYKYAIYHAGKFVRWERSRAPAAWR